MGVTAPGSTLRPLGPQLPSFFTLQLFPKTLIFLKLLVFFLPDVAVTRDCQICYNCLLLLFVHYHYVQLVSDHYLVCLSGSGSSIGSSFGYSTTTFGSVSNLDLGTSNPYSVQMLWYTMPATWLWHYMHALPASILQPAVICHTVSGEPLQSLP